MLVIERSRRRNSAKNCGISWISWKNGTKQVHQRRVANHIQRSVPAKHCCPVVAVYNSAITYACLQYCRYRCANSSWLFTLTVGCDLFFLSMQCAFVIIFNGQYSLAVLLEVWGTTQIMDHEGFADGSRRQSGEKIMCCFLGLGGCFLWGHWVIDLWVWSHKKQLVWSTVDGDTFVTCI